MINITRWNDCILFDLRDVKMEIENTNDIENSRMREMYNYCALTNVGKMIRPTILLLTYYPKSSDCIGYVMT